MSTPFRVEVSYKDGTGTKDFKETFPTTERRFGRPAASGADARPFPLPSGVWRCI